ncbi:EXS family-domain-containing protein [Limtongia smithiae]|uniref:EXS family-domain-containing protein n=1 Tax=Limtongia smithiae TaxID=1125753 RepID=UPI0034D00674
MTSSPADVGTATHAVTTPSSPQVATAAGVMHDAFSAACPLPYRVVACVIFGVWGWGLMLQLLSRRQINVESLLSIAPVAGTSASGNISAVPLFRPVYALATTLTLVYIVNATAFSLISTSAPTLLNAFGYNLLPLLCLASVPVVFLFPGYHLHRAGRVSFMRTLRRAAFGGLERDSARRFQDTLATDVLTSYAKVLGDAWIMMCMFFFCGGCAVAAAPPDRKCGGEWAVPLVIALPYLARLRQCLTEYLRSRGNGGKGERRHLWNAAKYTTTFPVIVLSVLQHQYDVSEHATVLGAFLLHNLWVLSMFVNSMFSFYWDVTVDWDLELFRRPPLLSASSASSSLTTEPKMLSIPQPTATSTGMLLHRGLRSILYFSPRLYYTAILLDLLFRFTWSIKLSPHLYFFNEFESGVFVLELIELCRRWVWLMLRIEAEWIKNTHVQSGRLPIAMAELGRLHNARD